MYNIIYNPLSGGGKKKKIHRRAFARLEERGAAYCVHETEKPGQAMHLARSLTEEGEGDIVVLGGDGTLHEVLCGFTNFDKCALGLIPAGTGNDFASFAGIPLEPEKAVDLILDGTPQYTEFMQLPKGVRGINVAGTGIDVEILQRCRRSKILRGKFQYIISLIISLCKFKNYKLHASTAAGGRDFNALIACVGNGSRIGGGIPIQTDEGRHPARKIHLFRALRARGDRARKAAHRAGRRRTVRRSALYRGGRHRYPSYVPRIAVYTTKKRIRRAYAPRRKKGGGGWNTFTCCFCSA